MNFSFSTTALLLALLLAVNGNSGVEANNNAVGVTGGMSNAAVASVKPLVNIKHEDRKLSDSDEDEEEASGEEEEEEERSDSGEDEEEEADEAEEAEEEEKQMAYYAYGAAGSATVLLSALGLLEWKRRVRVKTSADSGLIDDGIRTDYVSAVEMA